MGSIRLEVIEGEGVGETHVLSGISVLGRDRTCGLRISDRSVSREHAVVRPEEGVGFVIEDLDSRSGTYVNGVRTRKAVLLDGDTIRIGPMTLRVQTTKSIEGEVPLEDIEMGDHLIPEGAVVLVSIGAANHDPDVFSDPDELDIGRDPNPHLAFGFGAHFCLGSRLALLEAELVFGALVRRFPDLRLVDDCPVYRENPILRGLRALPLEF